MSVRSYIREQLAALGPGAPFDPAGPARSRVGQVIRVADRSTQSDPIPQHGRNSRLLVGGATCKAASKPASRHTQCEVWKRLCMFSYGIQNSFVLYLPSRGHCRLWMLIHY